MDFLSETIEITAFLCYLFENLEALERKEFFAFFPNFKENKTE